jgi:magnesium transporter
MPVELLKPAAEPPPPAAAAESEPGVIAAGVYAGGRRVRNTRIEDAGEWAKKPGHVVWIGLYEPSAELLRRVQQEFGLHELAIEDAGRPHQRPKLEQYGDALFIVARTAQLTDGRVAFGETHIFVGHGYVVSVRHGASTSYKAVRERCEACPIVLANGEDYILYAILDFIVDNYMPVIEAVHAEIDDIEDQVFSAALPQATVERLYMLRRDLLRLRNAIVPLIDVCRRLEHAEALRIDAAMQPLFRDVTDHVHRIQEEIDSLREVLAFAFEASLMAGQAQQADITRRLAAWAAILAVPTAVAGVYGMNFEFMPELEVRGAYFVVLGAIGAICATLFWLFRKHGWL